MTQPKQDILRTHLKQWMLHNADTYAAFEKMMNEQNDAGYHQILLTATTLLPSYKKALKRKFTAKTAIIFQTWRTYLLKYK